MPVKSITCNQGWDEVLIWYEMKVRSVTLTTSVLVFCGLFKCGRVGLFTEMCRRSARTGGYAHFSTVYCFCGGNIVSEYVRRKKQQLCSHWWTTSCLSMSHNENTLQPKEEKNTITNPPECLKHNELSFYHTIPYIWTDICFFFTIKLDTGTLFSPK